MFANARVFILSTFVTVFSTLAVAQADEICGETGATPFMSSAAVFGKVRLEGFDRNEKLPKITITLTERQGRENRLVIDRSGNYCFRDVSGGGGFLIVDIEGVEVARESLPSGNLIRQHRQDFSVFPIRPGTTVKPGSISAKFAYKRTEKNAKLFEDAGQAETVKDVEKALVIYNQIVAGDSKDFVSWSKIGSIQYGKERFAESEEAFMRSIEAKPDFGYAYLSLGQTYLVQKKIPGAINALKRATTLEPNVPRGFQLLGEAYLIDKKGTLGVEVLNEAIRLDPIGMAECHLLIAKLYDLAGAKAYAAREYKLFLEKVPNHHDKKKFERYIKDNPPEGI